ncbi:NADH:flavin oxidoreductase [Polymorphobacter megasporae]|uniref:NADH:flavin oxidoreductase n=1 Tax=Glacieibacterium megasporae TaxID=2835787 RepID=UPI001C1E298D|nr:NADH:flavin oxidoreductase [Polymorphobacter megasporae]UAJ11333.1 NADH:flavin oxidoreductase [Polymorphobacter megasporae]
MTNPLFRPFDMAGLHLPNRIVMAPMTRSFSPGGVPGANVAEYYQRRAEGQVGLIVTEGTGVNRAGSLNDPNVPVFHGEAALGGWGKVVDAVHGAHGKIAPQLWHVGAMKNPTLPDYKHDAEGPSGLLRPGKAYGNAMSDADIADTIAAFAQAAADAKRIGFDAVELHGAHGYLIDQFFWEGTNVRDDGWNGALPERARFAGEVVKAVKAAIGDLPLIIRLSQWKQQDFTVKLAATPDALAAWLNPLAEAGADVFHCSQRRFWEPEFAEIDGDEGLNFAGWAKKLTGKPTITVGSVGLSGEFVAGFGGEQSQPASLDNLLERLEKDEFDLVAVGRALIVDPDWAEKVRDGRMGELKDFDRGALATLV